RMRFSPRSSFARTLLLIVTLLFVSLVTTYLVVLNFAILPSLHGSWLLLLMPPYETWESRPDTDSLRWSDCAQPIPTPQFAQHLK
ncbi:two-component system sensor histidine kinase EnvZ, partial [Salmonella enterica subsp. enterica serovar Virginia]|nr:two-component system sensor histidine kinase EnvZ [Salmonella enterica subsp. enterica serovar Virginia]